MFPQLAFLWLGLLAIGALTFAYGVVDVVRPQTGQAIRSLLHLHRKPILAMGTLSEGALFISCDNNSGTVKYPKSKRIEVISCPLNSGLGVLRAEDPKRSEYDPFSGRPSQITARFAITNYASVPLMDVELTFRVLTYGWIQKGAQGSRGDLKNETTVTRVIGKIDPGPDNHEAVCAYNSSSDCVEILPVGPAKARKLNSQEVVSIPIEFDHFAGASLFPYDPTRKPAKAKGTQGRSAETEEVRELRAKLAQLEPPLPRRITETQLEAIKAAVQAMSQPGNNGFWHALIYVAHDFDGESGRYAKRLVAAMEAAGLQVAEGTGGVAEEDEYGIVVRAADPENLSPHGVALIEFMNLSGLEYTIRKAPINLNPGVQIMVARQKPAAL